MCQVWLKLAKWFWGRRFLNVGNQFSLYLPLLDQWFLRRRFLNVCKLFSLLYYYLPMNIWAILNPEHQRMPLCRVWLKLAQCFWRKRQNCGKFTTTTMTTMMTTDNGQISIGSGELKTEQGSWSTSLTYRINQSMNTFVQSYVHTITLIERQKKSLSPFWELSEN